MRAGINPNALETIADLTARGFPDCLNVLLQNARRAGASRVDIQIGDGTVTVCDNGHGVLNQDALLEYGTSYWKPAVRSERAPGIGLFALANNNVSITTRTTPDAGGPNKRDAWSMTLTPATFRGEETARVQYGVDGPLPTGTQVRFDAQHVKAWFIEQAVRYFDMEVYLDGQPTPQEPFLKDPDQSADWKGVRIGLYKGPPGVECPSQLSFHGSVSRLSIPTGAGRAYAKAEIGQSPASWLIEQPGLTTIKENAFSRALTDAIYDQLLRHFPHQRPQR